MSSTKPEIIVNPPTDDSSSVPAPETKRKVSIMTESPTNVGHDNMGYERNDNESPSRKISAQNSEDSIRKKSILHNPLTPVQQAQQLSQIQNVNTNEPAITQQPGLSVPPHHMNNHHMNEARGNQNSNHGNKKYSTTESLYSRHERDSKKTNTAEDSWLYLLCMRCRVQYTTPQWEPPFWNKFCPYPLCPSYRQFSRLLGLILIGVLLWVPAYAVIGKTIAPGGPIFSLLLLTVVANFGGYLVGLCNLPRLIGMLLTGILMQNIGAVDIDGIAAVTGQLRKIALVIILTRAGLEMDPEAFKKVWISILKLGLVPWCVEGLVNCVLCHYFFDMPWMWALLLGVIIGAVSPAVVVPCLFRLRSKGYGVAKGIPTLVVAVAGVDDAASVAGFGILASLMFSTGGLAFQISQAPVCILGGLGFGVFYGMLAQIVPEKGDAYAVHLRVIMLFVGGLMAVHGSELIKYEGAGPLAIVFAAFTSNYFWIKQGWTLDENPVSTAFAIFWMIFEPILFGLTGAAVKFHELDGEVVKYGLISLSAGAILRILATVAIAFGDKLNWREKIFVGISWMAKASVQAALGPVALRNLAPNDPQRKYGEIVLMMCILSIVLTAPTGAILISITGTKLLSKTKPLADPNGWRRSHRPSIRQLSINEEDELDPNFDAENPEMRPDQNTLQNTKRNTLNV